MAVLKANGSFLKANGKILKVSGGGQNLKTFVLDIKNLQLANHTDDNGISYTFRNVSKIDNDSQLLCSGNYDFYVYIPGKIKRIEAEISAWTRSGFNYFGHTPSSICRTTYHSGDGVWLAKNPASPNRWSVYAGTYNQTWNYEGIEWLRYGGMDFTLPIRYVYECDEEMKVYVNDNLIAKKINDFDLYLILNEKGDNSFTINGGGQTSGECVLKSLVITYTTNNYPDYNKSFALPNGYTKLSAIDSNGGWFNTGYVPNATDKIETRINTRIGGPSSYQALFGTRGATDNSNEWTVFLRFNSSYVLSPRHRLSNVDNTLLPFDYGVDRTLVFDGPNLQVFNESGDVVTNYTDSNPQGDCINPLYMFGTNWNGNLYDTGIQTRCYYLRIWDSNGNMKLNLIPCIRNSDRAAGMYDVVSNTFFTHSSFTGRFL